MSRRQSRGYRTHQVTIYKQRALPRWLLIGVPVLVGLAVLALIAKVALSSLPAFKPDPAAVQKEAKAAIDVGQPRKARGLLIDALKEDPSWKDGQLLLARATVLAEDGASALSALSAAKSAGAKPEDMNAIAGHAHWLNGDLAAAEKALKSPIAKADLAYANRILGRVYLDMNSPNEARVALDIAAEMAPKSAEVWHDIAVFRWRQFDIIGAIDAADLALKNNPKYPPALILRGDMAREQLGPVPAIAFYERALKQTPDSMPVLTRLAEAQGAAGRHKDMLATTRAMLKKNPKSGAAFYMQGVMAARAGQNDLARVLLEKAEEDMKDVPAYLLVAGAVEFRLGNYNRAVDRLERLARMQPNNLKVQRMLARALYEVGDAEGALALVKPLAERSDGDAYARMLTGRALEALDERGDAAPFIDAAALAESGEGDALPGGASLPVLAAAAAADPDNARAVIPYLRAMAANGEAGAALPKAERLRDKNPGIADAHMLVGDLLVMAGRDAAAVEPYRRAHELHFGTPVMLRLFDVLVRLDRDKDALAMLDAFEEANPDSLAAQQLRFDIAMENSDWAEAKAYGMALLARTGAHDPALLADMARALALSGEVDRAAVYAEAAYRVNPASPLATHVYGYVLMEQGKLKVVPVQLLEKAAAMVPDNGFIQYHLAKAYLNVKQPKKAKVALGLALKDADMPAKSDAEKLLKSL